MNLQVEESLLAKCQEIEETAREQATDNAILDQLHKVLLTISPFLPMNSSMV